MLARGARTLSAPELRPAPPTYPFLLSGWFTPGFLESWLGAAQLQTLPPQGTGHHCCKGSNRERARGKKHPVQGSYPIPR